MSYAVNTSVPVDRSQGEIRRILSKYGATGFAFGEQTTTAVVMFVMENRQVKFILAMQKTPDRNATGVEKKRYDQQSRSKWRCLVLAIKAKLECVESGIATFEEEFLSYVVLANGKRVGDVMIPQIETSYKTGKMPTLLGYDK